MGQSFSITNLIKEITFPNDYCLSINDIAGSESISGPQILKTHHTRIFSLQRKPAEDIYRNAVFSQFKYSFFSPFLYAQTATVSIKKKSLLEFAVRRYIRKLSLFDKGFHFCYDLISFNGEKAIVNIYVLQPDDVDKVLKMVPYTTKPVSTLVPLEYVLSDLISNTFDKPVVSLWLDDTHALFLATNGKEIVSRNVFTQPNNGKNIVDWITSSEYIESAIITLKRLFPNHDVSLLIWGKHYKALSKAIEKHPDLRIDEYLEDKISDKLDWEKYHGGYLRGKNVNPKGVIHHKQIASNPKKISWREKRKRKSILSTKFCKETLFSNPSLFGLSICKKSQTFISPQYRHTFTNYMRSRFALMASLLICMAFAANNFSDFLSQKKLENVIAEKSTSVEAGIKNLTTRIPGDETVKNLIIKAKIKKELISELNTSNFLSWLTNIAPDNSIIDNIVIESTSKSKENDKKKRQAQSREFKRYRVDLSMIIDRTYSDSIDHFDHFLAKLNEKVSSPQSKFIYKDIDDKLPSALTMVFYVEPKYFR